MIVSCPESPALAHAAVAGQKRPLSPDSSGASDERPASKSPRLSSGSASASADRVFVCPHCTYTTDRKGSLTRHLRVHVFSPEDAAAQPVATPAAARYCADCDIQFSSFKTYTVHKQFYCNTRAVQKQQQVSAGLGGPASPGLSTGTPSPAGLNAGLAASAVSATVATAGSCASTKSPGSALSAASALSASSAIGAGGSPQLANQPLFAAISTNPLVLVPCAFVPGSGLVPVQAGTTECASILSPAGAGGSLSPRLASARDAEEPANESILPDRVTAMTPRDSDQDSVATVASSSAADVKEASAAAGRKSAGEASSAASTAAAAAPLDLSTTPKKESSRDETSVSMRIGRGGAR